VKAKIKIVQVTAPRKFRKILKKKAQLSKQPNQLISNIEI